MVSHQRIKQRQAFPYLDYGVHLSDAAASRHGVSVEREREMPVLSSTAPEVTPEFEQQERDALSAEDLQKIHDEMYGISSSGDVVVVETEDEMSHSVASQLVQEALETIPDDIHKHAYNEAIQHHPNLVEKESNALTFMRSEGYNALVCIGRDF